MDVLDVMDAQKRFRAEELLEALNNAAMSHASDPKAFRDYTSALQRQAGVGADKKPEFDAAGFELMRMKLKGGQI